MALSDLLGFGTPDYCTLEGARQQAEKINEYWAERGYLANAYPVLLPYHSSLRESGYGVKSNLVNGVPTKRLPSLSKEAA